MADIFKGILGPMRGKIGNLVGRYMYGKGLLQTKGQTGVANARVEPTPAQYKMGAVRGFGSYIPREILSSFWKSDKRSVPNWALFCKVNYPFASDLGVLEKENVQVVNASKSPAYYVGGFNWWSYGGIDCNFFVVLPITPNLEEWTFHTFFYDFKYKNFHYVYDLFGNTGGTNQVYDIATYEDSEWWAWGWIVSPDGSQFISGGSAYLPPAE